MNRYHTFVVIRLCVCVYFVEKGNPFHKQPKKCKSIWRDLRDQEFWILEKKNHIIPELYKIVIDTCAHSREEKVQPYSKYRGWMNRQHNRKLTF